MEKPAAARRTRKHNLLGHVKRFLGKTPQERGRSLRYAVRSGLSRLPIFPFRLVVRLPSGETIPLWWSYVPGNADFARPYDSYWGDDIAELLYLHQALKPGMTFIDIGAHHGIYTLVASRRVGPKGRVVAFEPSARERRRLRIHVALNGAGCANVEPYAVASDRGRRVFYTVQSGFWNYATTMNGLQRPAIDRQVRSEQVRTISLDDYVARMKLSQVDVVKVDSEGAELEILSGAGSLLAEQRPSVICEVLDGTSQLWNYPARKIISRLCQYGYEWFDFRADGTLAPHQARDEYPEIRNYLAVPRERLHRIAPLIAA